MDDAAAARSLLSAKAVRERAHEMLTAGLRGELAHFTVDIASLGAAAHVVSELIRVNSELHYTIGLHHQGGFRHRFLRERG